jgi:hypothetical protein
MSEEYMEELKMPSETLPAAEEGGLVEEEIIVDVIDDTPEKDRNKEPMVEKPEPDDEEMASYSDRVKKRIHTLQRAYHEERRAKEQAVREQQEAITYAQNVVEQNKSLVKRTNTDATLLHESWKSKTEGDLASAKHSYKAAYESGDADALIEATEALNRASIRHENAITKEPALQQETIPVKSASTVYTEQPPDESAVKWAKANAWFGKDRQMTNLAYGVHEYLIEKGIHPVRDAAKYYEAINTEVRKRFPDYSWGDNVDKEPRQRPAATVVAPVTRTSTGKRVALTQTQVAIAKRLNIPIAEYARQVAVLQGAK